jgi:hypothetical protein
MFGLNAAVWGALSKAAEKQFEREALEDGARHVVSLDAVGTVDGVRFALDLDCVLTVGHGGVRSASLGVQPLHQLAYVFELLELAYGADAVADVVRDVRAKFAECGSIPASGRFLEIAEDFDKSLRVAKRVEYSGAVKVACVDVPQLALEALQAVG